MNSWALPCKQPTKLYQVNIKLKFDTSENKNVVQTVPAQTLLGEGMQFYRSFATDIQNYSLWSFRNLSCYF